MLFSDAVHMLLLYVWSVMMTVLLFYHYLHVCMKLCRRDSMLLVQSSLTR